MYIHIAVRVGFSVRWLMANVCSVVVVVLAI